MKKIFLLLSLILVVSKIEATGFITVDGLKFLVDTDKQEATLVANDYSGDIVVPESVTMDGKKYPVTVFASSCFKNCTKLQNVVIPKTVTTLGDNCFSGSSITEIRIPYTVKTIGKYCFYLCTKLVTAVTPTLSEGCFCNCSSLAGLNIPTSVTVLPNRCFMCCSNLTTINIPTSITTLEDLCFYQCKQLKTLQIPNSVTSLKYKCFAGCESLKELYLPSSISTIGYGCFEDCYNLEKANIPTAVTRLEGYTFYKCSKIKDIEIPNGINYIGQYCFDECNKMTSISIPSSVTSISDNAFPNSILEIKSLATTPPNLTVLALNQIIETCLIYVPKDNLDDYKNAEGWKKFNYIYSLNNADGKDGETENCASPSISYIAGKIRLNCNTSNAVYHYTIADADIKTDAYSETGEIPLEATYKISAYATADGYKSSDKATATLYWINANLETTGINQAKTRGVVASCHDGFVSISGLDNNEPVSFYTVDGKALGTKKAISGTINYAIGNNTKIVIARIGENSIKIMNN